MEWPRTPVERIPHNRFRPQFCPRRDCAAHTVQGSHFRCVRKGSHFRKCDRRTIPRFRCESCHRTFSLQSFATTYYLKRPKLLLPVAAGLVAGSAARQIARSLGCSHTTVVRLGNRLGRHGILLQSLALQNIDEIRESVVLDHFAGFQSCQEMPVGVGTPVGSRSLFTYDLDPVPCRLGGRMTVPRQKRLERLVSRYGTLPKGSFKDSTAAMVDSLLRKIPKNSTLHLVTDKHPAYGPAIRSLKGGDAVRHEVHPNPERGEKGSRRSRKAIARDRAMFPVDLLHKLFRHSSANHKRETIAFGKRGNAILLRLFLLIGWRNFIKDRSERKPTRRSPAMELGLADQRWTWRTLLSQRLFPERVHVEERWMVLYRQEMVTPAVGHNLLHAASNAF